MQSERDGDELWFLLAAAALLTLAAAIRFANLGHTLFEDEVWVANLMQHGGLRAHTYSIPPLFYAIGRAWVSLRGASDVALREPAATFGVLLGALPFCAPLPRMTRFLWSALLLFSSPLIFYSERLKQYTLEASAATLLIILFLRATRDDRLGGWLLFFAAAGASVLVLHSAVFLVFAMGVAVVLSRRLRQLSLIAGFVVVGALAVVGYLGYMAPGPETMRLHGDMDLFFAANGRWVTTPAVLFAATKHWTGHAFNLTQFWWVIVIPIVALWMFAKRDLLLITLAAAPPAAVAIASAAHKYPYGEVRLMIFCLPALFLVTADALATAARRVPLLLTAVIPFILIGVIRDPYNATYMRLTDMHTTFATVARSTEPIYADGSVAAPLGYYYPALMPRMHIGALAAPSGPGWYLQRAANFDPGAAGVVIREGAIVTAHVP